MLGNSRVDTKPEVTLRSAFHAMGLRFRKNYLLRLGGIRFRTRSAMTALLLPVPI